MTEWELQELLTPLWMERGIDLAGEQLVLVAWEVMLPSWKINDPSETWLPSIDFVALDSDARLVAIELKTSIRGRNRSGRC